MPLALRTLTSTIIGAAIDVHRTLGPGFVEAIYAKALQVELRRRRVKFSRELRVPVCYRGVEVGVHRLDLFVENRIVVELKVVKILEPVHFAIVRSYLRAVKREHGLLFNLGGDRVDVRRVFGGRLRVGDGEGS